MGFWLTLLVINLLFAAMCVLGTGIGSIYWKTMKKWAQKSFYFRRFKDMPPYPVRALVLTYLNAVIIINMMVIVIYLGNRG
jgi:hypothetical protein